MRYVCLFCFLSMFFCTSAGVNYYWWPASACTTDRTVALSLNMNLPVEDCDFTIHCHSGINIYLPQDACEISLNTAMVVYEAVSSCGSSSTLWLSNNGPYPVGTHTVTVHGTSSGSYNNCQASFNVVDNSPPELDCIRLLAVSDQPEDYAIPVFDLFTATDNCEVADNVLSFENDFYPGYGTADVYIQSFDAADNESRCYTKVALEPDFNRVYCRPQLTGNIIHIERFALYGLGSIVNHSGTDYTHGYYVNYSADLRKGSIAAVQLTPDRSRRYNRWSIYIDLDQNGNFEASESVYEWEGIGYHSGRFQVPDSKYVRNGETRMRVMMAQGVHGPCDNYYVGEIEDYTVNLVPSWGTGRHVAGTMSAESTQLASPLEAPDGFLPVSTSSLPATQASTYPPARQPLVYPNPFLLGDAPKIELPAGHGVQFIEVSNALGQGLAQQAVYNQDAHTIELSRVSDAILFPGLYLLAGINNNGQRLWTKRLLVE